MIDSNEKLCRRAQDLRKNGRCDEALPLFRQLLGQTTALEDEFEEWLVGAIDCCRRLDRHQEAGYGLVYLHRYDEARRLFGRANAALERARCLELEARTAPVGQSDPLFLQAAREYQAADRPVLAALAYAAAGPQGVRDARHCWEQVLASPRLRSHPYEQALCHFNVSITARRDDDLLASNRHLVQAQRLLEELADEFEARGERERAFDCYGVLLQIGREIGSFENIAEGYINCIRFLKSDNMKYYAMQYYDDFFKIAISHEEFHAAATVCSEAADYARRVGLSYDRGYLKRAAETWWKAAEKSQRSDAPVELTENAYLAAIGSFSAVGDLGHVRESYQRLAALPLGDKKRQRYTNIAARYERLGQTHRGEPALLPEHLRHLQAYPATWEQDLVEWELDGDPVTVCSMVVGDMRQPEMLRRHALNVLWLCSDLEQRDAEPGRLSQIAQALGELKAYAALRPLERFFTHEAAAVRRGVMKAARHLYFKRTFRLVDRGLRDEAAEVREAALEAVSQLHFPAAVDPLTRIFRETQDLNARIVVLRSLGRTNTLEAGELLIDVLCHESERLQDVAFELLKSFKVSEVFQILRRHAEFESGPARERIVQLLRNSEG